MAGWSRNEGIGVLHRLWWWCLSYAEDGDLSKYTPEQVAFALEAKLAAPLNLYKLLIECGFLRKDLKIHDWLDYAGRYLQTKYRSHYPEKLIEIHKKYEGRVVSTKVMTKVSKIRPLVDTPNQPTNLTNLNQPNLTNKGESGFDQFWKAYPKKKSKGQAEKAWLKIKPNEQLLETILSKIEQAKTSEDWTKDKGKYIPHPATWLNAEGWHDEYTQPVPWSDTTSNNLQAAKRWLERTGETDGK